MSIEDGKDDGYSLGKSYSAPKETIQRAIDAPPPTNPYRRSRTQKPESRSGEVHVRRVDPRVLGKALQLADYDSRRFTYGNDGSITVWNNPYSASTKRT